MRILIFHTGSLGDTLVCVPALWAIREHFRDAQVTLMSDVQIGSNHVQAQRVLDGSGLIDNWICYPVENSLNGTLLQPLRTAKLLVALKSRRFDTVVYLIRSGRSARQIRRDVIFFRLAGIRNIIGHRGFYALPQKRGGQPLPQVPHQSDQILARLSLSSIPAPSLCNGNMDLRISQRDREGVNRWVRDLPADGGRAWVGIGPGSKMPSKIWPPQRYGFVVSELIKKHDIWPVVFGGSEDRTLGNRLVQVWGRGHLAAGQLNIRQGIAALQRCRLYLGNDTGTMHMAVTAGTPCVALFSSRDYPGNWYPYGNHHVVFRTQIECEGCMLEACTSKANACLLSINEDEVYRASSNMLSDKTKAPR